jgi:hypothetical protein
LLLLPDLLPELLTPLPERCPVLLETDWPEDDELLSLLTEVLLSELLAADSLGAPVDRDVEVVDLLELFVLVDCLVVPEGAVV